MKRRILALLLAVLTLTMLTSFAFAEETEVLGVYNVTGPLTVKNGTQDGGFYANADIFELNCTGLTGQYSLVLLLAGSDPVPTESNIQYIDQLKVVNGAAKFTLKPKQLTEGTYYIYVSTTYEKLKVVASFDYGPEPEYTLGDVDGNGAINIADVSSVLSYIAALTDFSDREFSAADVSIEKGKVDIRDVAGILYYIVYGKFE